MFHNPKVSVYILWTYVKDKPHLQKLYNIFDKPELPVKAVINLAQLLNDTIERKIIRHPVYTDFGLLHDSSSNVITCKTKLIPISISNDKFKKLEIRVVPNNYLQVNIKRNGGYKPTSLHRLIAHIFHNLQIDDKTVVVNHINGDTLDWHPSNLEVITRSYNRKFTHKMRTEEFHKNNEIRLKEWTFKTKFLK